MPLPETAFTNTLDNIQHIINDDYDGFLQACLKMSSSYKERYDGFIKEHIQSGDLFKAIRQKAQDTASPESPWHDLLRSVISIKLSFDQFKPVVEVLTMIRFTGQALLTCALADRTEARFMECEGHRFRLPTNVSKSIMYARDGDCADVFFCWGKKLEGSIKTPVLSFDVEQGIYKPGSLHILSTLNLTKQALVTTFSFVEGSGVRISGAIPDTIVDSETISAIAEQRITEPVLRTVYDQCCAKSFLSRI